MYVHIHRYRKKTRTPLDFETCACACAKLCSKHNGRYPLPRILWLQPEKVVRDTPVHFFFIDYTRHAGWGAKTRREGREVQIYYVFTTPSAKGDPQKNEIPEQHPQATAAHLSTAPLRPCSPPPPSVHASPSSSGLVCHRFRDLHVEGAGEAGRQGEEGGREGGSEGERAREREREGGRGREGGREGGRGRGGRERICIHTQRDMYTHTFAQYTHTCAHTYKSPREYVCL
jgi:hypothetical protein